MPTNILVDQTEVRFVYKRCALKRVAGTLTGAAFLYKRSEGVCRPPPACLLMHPAIAGRKPQQHRISLPSSPLFAVRFV